MTTKETHAAVQLSSNAESLLARGILEGGSEEIDAAYYAQLLGLSRDTVDAALRELVDTGHLYASARWPCPHCGGSNYDDAPICTVCGDTRPLDLEAQVFFFRKRHVAERDPAAVFLIHGMNTLGAWQESLAWRLQLLYGRSIPVFVFKYGSDRTSPFLKVTQDRRLRQLGAALRRATADLRAAGRPAACDVIAHSFGTLLFARLLTVSDFQDLAFGKVIFTGSIAPRHQPWSRLFAEGRLEGLMLHRAGRDAWVRLAPWVFPNTGASGLHGFLDDAWVEDVCSADFRHSDYFADAHFDGVIRNLWSPFLTTQNGIEQRQGAESSDSGRYHYIVGRCLTVLVLIGAGFFVVKLLLLLCWVLERVG